MRLMIGYGILLLVQLKPEKGCKKGLNGLLGNVPRLRRLECVTAKKT